jgi:hypothetical protein
MNRGFQLTDALTSPVALVLALIQLPLHKSTGFSYYIPELPFFSLAILLIMSVPIPQPPGVPLLGNVWDIDPKQSLLSLAHIAEKYGTSTSSPVFSQIQNKLTPYSRSYLQALNARQ